MKTIYIYFLNYLLITYNILIYIIWLQLHVVLQGYVPGAMGKHFVANTYANWLDCPIIESGWKCDARVAQMSD